MKENISQDYIKLDIPKSEKKNTEICLEEEANVISRLFFYWTGILVTFGNKKYLEEDDLFDVRKDEKIFNTLTRFRQIQENTDSNGKKRTYVASLWRLIRANTIYCGFLSIISNLLQFSGPLILGKILSFLSNPTIPMWEGYMWASILFGCYLLRNVLQQQSMHTINHISILVNNSLYSTIFEKIMKMSSSAKKYQDVGKVMNLINVDSNTIYGFTQMMMFLFSSPVVIIVSITLICLQVGVIGLIGPGLLILGMIVQNLITTQAFKYRRQSLQFTDKRSKALSEFFSGIKIIKYYAWENVVYDKIQSIREKEVSLLFKQIVLRGMTDVVATTIPILISITVFGVYYALGNELTASKAYTTLSLFNLLQMPLRMATMVLMMFASSKASLRRLEHFSKTHERTMEEVIEDPSLETGEIIIQNGDFNWDTDEAKKHEEEGKKLLDDKKKPNNSNKKLEPTKISLQAHTNAQLTEKLLQNNDTMISKDSLIETRTLKSINFRARSGEFIAVVGQVGSGKTSFLNALLGEINPCGGTVRKNGTIAYVPQTAWLMNASVRDNILFGKEFNEERYNHVLKICELESDLLILPGGDLTEIGERGVNLSGGQKQRVALARAIYDNADIYIIDDCLAALDAHVGKNVFYNVLKGELKGKTVIFVTHALHYVSEVPRVVVFKNGSIVETGTAKELMQKEGEYVRLNVQYQKCEEEKSKQEIEEEEEKQQEPGLVKQLSRQKSKVRKSFLIDNSKEELKKKQSETDKLKKGNLIKIEQKAEGSVPWRIYSLYISSGGGLITFFTMTSFVFTQIFKVSNDWWLGIWSERNFNLETRDYILIYVGLSLASGLMVFIRAFLFGRFAMNTAQSLQQKLINRLLKSPMWWFDITPSGRILSRTTKDQDSLDSELPWGIQFSISNLLILFSSILMSGIITPLYLGFAFFGIIVYVLLVKYYIKAAREIKRIELNSRAPLISHFSETCQGIYVIRSFKRNEKFTEKFYEKSINLTRALQNFQFAGRWIANYSEIFGSFIVAATAYFGVLSRSFNYMSNPALIGLALSSALNISTMLSFTIRILANTESQMSSVQRIIDYIENNPSEKEFEIPKVEDKKWPEKGEYIAENITYRYRPELDDVIHGISFAINKNEKIGVVGRTGSGKSTLTLGLLRILEIINGPDGKKGSIKLDDIDIESIGLHEVRKKVTIIPQDPTLFTGTVRFNIDPFNEFNDDDIISALKKVRIWEAITITEEGKNEEKDKLEMAITDGGSNFSLGQRQLLCMARALIRRPKVLLMDEATASIDEMTDHLIQKMIRTEFKETTVITIAHRLNTIIQYDKIMVMDHGNIAEFDSANNLFLNEDSYFSKLIKEQGSDFERRMKYLASHKEEILEKDGILDVEEIYD